MARSSPPPPVSTSPQSPTSCGPRSARPGSSSRRARCPAGAPVAVVTDRGRRGSGHRGAPRAGLRCRRRSQGRRRERPVLPGPGRSHHPRPAARRRSGRADDDDGRGELGCQTPTILAPSGSCATISRRCGPTGSPSTGSPPAAAATPSSRWCSVPSTRSAIRASCTPARRRAVSSSGSSSGWTSAARSTSSGRAAGRH